MAGDGDTTVGDFVGEYTQKPDGTYEFISACALATSALRASTSTTRCPALRPDPAQRHRLADILASLRARLAEAREQGWGGEIAGLEVSVAAAGQKLQDMDQLAARHRVTHLCMPDFRPSAGRSSGAPGGS